MTFISLASKFRFLVIASCIVIAACFLFIVNIHLNDTIDRILTTIYSAKLDEILETLKSGERQFNAEISDKDSSKEYRASTIEALRKEYYIETNQRIYPFIVDTTARVVMHPTLPVGDLSLRENEHLQKVFSAQDVNLIYTYLGQKTWCAYRQFPELNWIIGYTIPIDIKYAEVTRLSFLLLTMMLVTIVLVVLVASLIITRFTNPIIKLTKISTQIANGNLDQPIDLEGWDEIGMLAHSFSRMRNAIKKQVAKLNNEIAERKRAELALIKKEHFSEALLNDMLTFVAVLELSGEVVFVNNTPLKVGGMELEDVKGKKFYDAFWWSYSQEVQTMIKRDVELCATGKTVAHDIQIRTADGSMMWIEYSMHPIFDEDGSVQYLIPEGRDITERRRAERALIKKERFSEALLNDMLTFVAVLELNGEVVFVNNTPLKVGGIELEDVKGKKFYDAFWWSYSQEVQTMIKCDIELCASGKTVAHDIQIRTTDGSMMWIEYSMHPIFDEDGSVQYLIPEGRDITERKRAERKLEETNIELAEHKGNLEEKVRERTSELKAAQKELVDNAHKAGMSDIAATILHNVGNILNSVKTSIYKTHEGLDGIGLKGFKKANRLLKKNIDRIDEFILEDPKGKMLLEYYLAFGDQFDREMKNSRMNLGRLKEKIDTICNIVSEQQSFVHAESYSEVMDLCHLMDNALDIQQGSIERHGLHIEKKYENIPQVRVQKTKLLHTLINLIKNAKESILKAENPLPKLIRIVVTKSEHHAYVRIVDNGCGIKEENLINIFNYGFTEKPQGHGIGLHSCANYLTEMGGRIWAESEGEGKGATYILELPLCENASCSTNQTR